MMFNPWIILAVVLAIGGAGAGGYFKGASVQADKDKAAQLVAVDQAIQDANRAAEQDKRAAVAAAEKSAKAKTRTITIRSKADATIRAQPLAATCDWNSDSFGVLNSAILAANDQPEPASGLPDAVRAANGPGKQ